MHEHSLIQNLVNKLTALSEEHNKARVVSIKVILGALSHTSPDHFREHLEEFAPGSCFENAKIEFIEKTDIHDPQATGIYLESVELEDKK
mgnify:FL=1